MANAALGSKKSRYAMGAVCLAGAALLLLIFAGTEQSIRSNGDPEPAALTLQQLIAEGPGRNGRVLALTEQACPGVNRDAVQLL